jgi:hypothetical protein
MPIKRTHFSSEINWTRDKDVGIQVLTARARGDCMPFETWQVTQNATTPVGECDPKIYITPLTPVLFMHWIWIMEKL